MSQLTPARTATYSETGSVQRQRHSMLFTILLLVWAACFWQTLWSMVEIWSRSDTFAHGFLIFPISLFLIWQKRLQIQQTAFGTAPFALLIIFLLVCIWFLADAATVNVIKQLSAVLLLPALVLLCFGRKLFSLLLFPLAYLIFAVPMGEALVPALQNITADMVVIALQLTNIPVYREGFYLSTPTGNFLVAEACSGIRYLIASFALGTLYAYLTYQKKTKQLIFCLISLIVPIIANGIRAYGIVLIAHLSDMKYAVGVDHLIYGWLFFGLLIFLMFYVGSFWADKKTIPAINANASACGHPGRLSLLAAATLLLPYLSQLLLPPLTASPDFRLTALQHTLQPDTHQIDQPEFVGSSTRISGLLPANSQPVLFYAAFYLHSDNNKLVSWHNQPYQRKFWTPDANIRHTLTLADNRRFSVQETDLRALNGQQRLLWYWYGSGDFFSANSYLITFMQAAGKVLHTSQHGSFYALSLHYEGSIEQARQQLNNTLQQIFPLILEANTPAAKDIAACNNCPAVQEFTP